LQYFGKLLILFGAMMVLLGVILTFARHIPYLGRLPGDIRIERDGFFFYFPLVTCIVLSVLLTLILNIFRR